MRGTQGDASGTEGDALAPAALLRSAEVPRLCSFYGIAIYMYRPDHPPRHFHARYGEHWAKVALDGSTVLEGHLPSRALRLVQEWARLHEAELAFNWDLAQRLEALSPFDPLP
jgi:hypothetical protein